MKHDKCRNCHILNTHNQLCRARYRLLAAHQTGWRRETTPRALCSSAWLDNLEPSAEFSRRICATSRLPKQACTFPCQLSPSCKLQRRGAYYQPGLGAEGKDLGDSSTAKEWRAESLKASVEHRHIWPLGLWNQSTRSGLLSQSVLPQGLSGTELISARIQTKPAVSSVATVTRT